MKNPHVKQANSISTGKKNKKLEALYNWQKLHYNHQFEKKSYYNKSTL